jgi:hypothetical protein
MKVERTHDYAIQDYGKISLSAMLAVATSSIGLFGRGPVNPSDKLSAGFNRGKSRRRSWRYFTASWLAPKKTASTSIITTIKA